MAPRGETRERMLRTASDLFQRQGFHGTGLQQVLADSGAPKGSLYFHFPGGKEQLAAEAVSRSGRGIRDAIERLLASADDVSAAMAALAGLLAAGLESSGFERGCPVATVVLDAATGSELIRSACEESFGSWLDLIASKLRTDGLPADEAEARAVLILSALEGALILARARGDTQPLRLVAEQLRGEPVG